MAWRVARSLDVLLAQLNTRYPARSRVSDGSIGDAAHSARTSDHNPDSGGVVRARDFTHDPARGVDIDRLSDELAGSRDPRIKYVIANGLIMDTRPGLRPWQWVGYGGSNPHTRHLHLSVVAGPLADDPRPWALPMLTQEEPMPTLDEINRLLDERALREHYTTPARRVDVGFARDQIRADLAAVKATTGEILKAVTGDDVDIDALLARIDVNVRAALAETHPASDITP